MREILLPIGLVVLGAILIAAEAFIPSAGILGILSAVSLAAGLVLAFYYGGAVIGTVFMLVSGVAISILIYKMVRWWPHSTIGKLILVEPPSEEELLVDRSETQSMVGRIGQALGLMVPGGYVEIDGKRFDAVANVAVEAGSWVEVTSVTSGRILKVRRVSSEKAEQLQRERQLEGDPLSIPAKNVLDDPFEDALG